MDDLNSKVMLCVFIDINFCRDFLKNVWHWLFMECDFFFFFTDSIIHIFVYFEMQILQKVISRARDTIPVRSLSTKEVIMFCHSYSIPNFPF
jgi:hypothetical protein